MKRKVAFLELPVFHGVLPLASGYMQAFAARDPVLGEKYAFSKHSMAVKTPFEKVLETMIEADADVYALSCYVWNSGTMKRLLPMLRAAKPNAYFVLGGPQVMHQAPTYLPSDGANVIICNGEGERTFSNILRQLLAPDPDFASVPGISYRRDGDIFTNDAEPRITDLAEVPSPFLEGVFEPGKYSFAVLETNRGCPFKCNYCYWGAAIGAKVFKYGEERVRQELEWIAASGSIYLFLADANWGMLQRDVELSKHLAECKDRHGTPNSVYFCGAKNSPGRVAEITEILHGAGMVATQSVALQTMSPESLRLINRDNVKTTAYTSLQKRLNEKKISSFIEIIWPLPGETLKSFKAGLGELCRHEADSFLVYPLLLMNNVELNTKRTELGLITRMDPDPSSEAEIVVGTNQVNVDDYHDGVRYMFSVTLLYVLRGLWCTTRYLNERGLASFEEVMDAFVEHCREHLEFPHARCVEDRIDDFTHHQFDQIGGLIHLDLHSERDRFDELLADFVSSQPFWADETVRALFEIDLLNRPYVYLNTRVTAKRYAFEFVKVLEVLPRGYRVQVPERFLGVLGAHLGIEATSASNGIFTISHSRDQMPHMPRKTDSENWSYCHDMLHRIRSLSANWTPAGAAEKALAAATG